ncbi:YceI family protein [Streptomyces sp. HC44]|uniref:YceI family protein n=1 Tax=Streptomyces scabichelini TaxID=2711217 RepID=A0A6G4VP71_9ACTN|nr:YceI family protein [Streptomyces scabichelini]NGO15635.1 YceI family protein [Streptomyces scabichelini]
MPRPGRYAVAPGRSLVELTARYGPLTTWRRRVTLAGASLTVPEPTVPEDGDLQPVLRPVFRFDLRGSLKASLTSEHVEPLDGGRKMQLTADLDIRGVRFPVLLPLRVVSCADDRLLVVGAARLPYRLLRRATGFRLPLLRPATRLRLLLAAEFA